VSLPRTQACELLGIELPIVQAPIGSASGPELAAAVADAGGLGMLAVTWSTAEEASEKIREARRLTERPVGVNVVLDFEITAQLEACLRENVGVVSTFWGDPAAVSETIRAAGALHVHAVGSVPEARAAVAAGVDVVVAQGWEAGGRVRGEVATLPLVPAVVDAVAPVPVIAAGGIGDGRGLAAVLLLGAQAGWLGTRFLTSTEARNHDVYRQRVIAARSEDAVRTMCFDGGWPDAPHRALRNTTLEAWEAAGQPASPSRPGEEEVVATDSRGGSYRRYEATMPLQGMDGAVDEMAMYAGQSAALVNDTAPAAEIVARLVTEAAAALEALPKRR
jgi:nitronate monooxygenase